MTQGLTPDQVIEAIGRVPDAVRKMSPGRFRLQYDYYVEGRKHPAGPLYLYFVDGQYASANW